ncbi:hypothetical protein DRP05_14885 [Archaeoglobales archaeon]|nr:MAG: hypothetical protein DRP05_14885 [Archaeoglobales archaeon]
MKIGIKYCGGCNPTYSREKIEEYIRKYFSNAEVIYTSNPENVDIMVCISGCKRGCAIESINRKDMKKVVFFDEYKTELEVVKKIEEVLLCIQELDLEG